MGFTPLAVSILPSFVITTEAGEVMKKVVKQ